MTVRTFAFSLCVGVWVLGGCGADNAPRAASDRVVFTPQHAVTARVLASARTIVQRRVDRVHQGLRVRIESSRLEVDVPDRATATRVAGLGERGGLALREVRAVLPANSQTTPNATAPSGSCRDLVDGRRILWDETSTDCYVLGPSLLGSESVATARAEYRADDGGWGVDVRFRGNAFMDRVATRYVAKTVAVVVDDVVISAPVINPGITGTDIRISGGFTRSRATRLAIAFATGALPVAFTTQVRLLTSSTTR